MDERKKKKAQSAEGTPPAWVGNQENNESSYASSGQATLGGGGRVPGNIIYVETKIQCASLTKRGKEKNPPGAAETQRGGPKQREREMKGGEGAVHAIQWPSSTSYGGKKGLPHLSIQDCGNQSWGGRLSWSWQAYLKRGKLTGKGESVSGKGHKTKTCSPSGKKKWNFWVLTNEEKTNLRDAYIRRLK